MTQHLRSAVTISRNASTSLCSDELDEIRTQLDKNGYSYIRGISPGDFDYPSFAARLGNPIPHHNGELIWDVRLDPTIESIYHAGNMGALLPHTEAVEHPGPPPRYIMLWCVREARGRGGETTLADGYAWMKSLSEETRRSLHSNRYTWKSSDGIIQSGYYSSAVHPILEEFDGRHILRYDYIDVEREDDGLLDAALEDVKEFFGEQQVAVKIEPGCILVWDNWRMLHGRNAFSDPERHLKRMLLSGR
ncbi:TauD/TfdA family dioxygenase [Streptomyces filipinensis]|uniref:TauD/TfdA family dioxygenase n=1 Tax=Streptomyces filipinensis TaxID=66887 RepID=UPI00177A8D34|nr:TauD/TfdA family dioxygenase [Streptomyces filipinensis]